MKSLRFLFFLLFLSPMLLAGSAQAQQMEFDVGFAYDRPIDKPLPELSGGFGFNFSACLWIRPWIGLAIGAMGTKHDYDAGDLGNQSFTYDAERDVLYLEGRFRAYRLKKWEFVGLAGYTFSNNIHGGDSTGGYLEYQREYENAYDSERIGYDGSGFWLGFSAHRAIQSFHQGYFLFASVRYMFVNYHTNQFYIEVLDSSQRPFLQTVEQSVDVQANSLSVHLGIILRFDFADF